MGILDQEHSYDLLRMKPLDSLDLLSEIIQEIGIDKTVDVILIKRIARKLVYYWTKNDGSDPEVHLLKDRWYRALQHGEIDFGIYGDQLYLSEAWATWIVRSRRYLKGISKNTSLPPLGVVRFMGEIGSVLDLGCGIGFSTAALFSIFQQSTVVGTNIIGTMQTRIAEALGARIGYSVKDVKDVSRPIDLIFASEYFEHFLEPIAHVRELLEIFDPKFILFANAFGVKAAGHFVFYMIDGHKIHGSRMGKIFNDYLIKVGYEHIHANLWNNRPSLWRKKIKASNRELNKISKKQKSVGFGFNV